MWRETHLTKAWVSWYAILEEFYEVRLGSCACVLLWLFEVLVVFRRDGIVTGSVLRIRRSSAR